MDVFDRTFDRAAIRLGIPRRELKYLVIALIVVIIVVLASSDAKTALLIIGAGVGIFASYFLARGASTSEAYELGRATGELSAATEPRGGSSREGFSAAPAIRPAELAAPPYALNAGYGPPATDVLRKTTVRHDWYPGAIDLDEYDTEPDLGHRDRTVGDNNDAAEGNPFELSRVGAPEAADACADDEANDGEIDTDEGSVYSALARNDATRVTAGTMNRRTMLDKYFREEIEESADREWWGRHEV